MVLGVAAAIGLAAAAVMLVLTAGGSDSAQTVPATTLGPPPTEAPRTTVVAAPPPTTAAPVERVWPDEPTCPEPQDVVGELVGAADVDLDGCTELVGRTGNELHVGARRFELGVDGDHVVVGDWTCDGQATPALVSATDGAVHPFPSWPDDAPLDVEAVAIVGEVATVRAVEGDECDALVVELVDGTSQEIAW